jgi:alkylation response protein AidB-like acyl-CoA dehydrogenase
VDLDLTPEQELLAESVRRTCARHAGLDVVRKFENDPVGYPSSLWEQLAELGVLGLLIPERHGGNGMPLLDAAAVYTELGRALAPTPQLVSCVLAAGVLRRAAGEMMQEQWLPRIATGEAVVSVAWLEPDGGFGERGITTTLTPDGDGWLLGGRKRHVPFARAADALLTVARGPGGIVIALVDPASDGVRLEQQLTIAGDAQFAVRFDDVHVDTSAVITDDAWAAWHDTMLDVAVLAGAQAAGGARAALDLAVDYSRKREQFDRPLGAFQAIAHYLADATTAVDGAETLVWEAAWCRSVGRPVDKLAPMAKLFACRTFRDVTAMAQQVFGGNGFTVDVDIQLCFRRAKSLQVNWWDERHLEELIAAQVLDVSTRQAG